MPTSPSIHPSSTQNDAALELARVNMFRSQEFDNMIFSCNTTTTRLLHAHALQKLKGVSVYKVGERTGLSIGVLSGVHTLDDFVNCVGGALDRE